MNTRLCNLLCTLTLILYSTTSFAYKVETHKKVSENAIEASILKYNTKGTLESVGLPEINQEDKFPDYQGNLQTTTELIRFGSKMEDDMKDPFTGQAIRALNHFYSPAGNSAPYDQWLSIGYPTPDWALAYAY